MSSTTRCDPRRIAFNRLDFERFKMCSLLQLSLVNLVTTMLSACHIITVRLRQTIWYTIKTGIPLFLQITIETFSSAKPSSYMRMDIETRLEHRKINVHILERDTEVNSMKQCFITRIRHH